MWFHTPDPEHPGTSIRSTALTIGVGLFVAVWIVWIILNPFLFESEVKEKNTRETEAVRIPMKPTLPGIDLEHATDLLVEAVVQIESQGNPRMVGSVGERGLMQIRESTWNEVTRRHFGKAIPFSRAFEPELNRQVGRLYLGDLQTFLYEYQSDWQSDLRTLLLACYNAGPDRVRIHHFNVRRLPQVVQSYAQRGSNLHDWYLKQDASTLHSIMDAQLAPEK
jgi:hypothetical protein